MSSRRWSNVSYLDAIRPDPAWRTDFALLGSYSADLVALVAALLALAGLDDDRGSGSKVDFANAVEQLADRVRLVFQAGRLVAPAKTPKILAILDRYVREANPNEAVASWHPKVALTKHISDDDKGTQWRLWIGSRNLTRDLSWDTGLTLVGRPDGGGRDIPGVSELAQILAEHAQLPGLSASKIRSELRRVRWEPPNGCSVQSLRLLTDGARRGLPVEPQKLQRLTVVSPFLDGTIVGRLGKWGDAHARRILVSSRTELSKLAVQAGKPLEGFAELLYLDAPISDEQAAGDISDRENAKSLDEEPEARGLHAKLIYAESPNQRRLWTGSANATLRGWEGPNVEVMAEMEISPEVASGLEVFITELAKTVRLDELGAPSEANENEDRLELARKQVASSWAVSQSIEINGPLLTSLADPNPSDSEISLSVGLLGGPSMLWSHGALALQLPQVPAGEITELVSCRLCLSGSSVSWLQRTPLAPSPGEDRDRQALARYLDPRTFLLWIRSLLTDDPTGDGGGDWDEDPNSRNRSKPTQVGPSWWAPTLEEVLKAWSRDPRSLITVDKKVRHYLKLYQEQTDIDQTAEERSVVEEFHKTWQVLRRELVLEAP